ncbi:MAG: AAA family ATPase [Gammaproteobacteria bacterium]|nr:AAA family ATPase [Gammaproteobacteria bacterium]
MRPRHLAEVCGQHHLLGEGKPLRRALAGGRLHSMIFWGPPGSGKTTLARLVANAADLQFLSLSAVLSGVKDIRAAIDRAKAEQSRGTVLFIDEVHRFNKSQQDAFLPQVEDGTVIFIGATTENPSFEVNNALLSRARVYVLQALEAADLVQIITAAVSDEERGLGPMGATEQAVAALAQAADGDARRALTFLEIAADLALGDGMPVGEAAQVRLEHVQAALSGGSLRRFDKGGDAFYDLISALHKSVRGSDPDASLYWLARMLDVGCDPLYIARRLARIASEDIGNADPRALAITLDAWDTQVRLGTPEGELALGQAVVYLALAAKSNAVYSAFKAAMADAKEHGSLPVPVHLRNAPTRLMKELGHGRAYRYAHDEANAYAAGENYFPEALKGKRYYAPVERGLEIKLAEKLERLRELDRHFLAAQRSKFKT